MTAIRKYNDQSHPDVISGSVPITDGNVTEIIAAQGARQLMMDALAVYNTSATDAYVDILSGSTIIWSTTVPKGYGGSNMPFPKPIPANPGEAINAKVSTGVNKVVVSIGAHILDRPFPQ